MSFRRRIVVLAAAAVTAAIALAAVVTYVVVRHELRGAVDASLRGKRPKVVLISRVDKNTAPAPGNSAAGVRTGQPVSGEAIGQLPADADEIFQAQVPSKELGGTGGLAQVTLSNGAVIRSDSGASLPTDANVRAVASGQRSESLRDATIRGVHMRVLTTRGPDRSTLQIANSLTDVDDTLGRLRWILFAVTIGGVGLASGFGVAVSRAAARPLGRLTATAEQVTATGELHHRIEPEGDDEPGRLATSFNAMLGALDASRDAQRQLVADASHELRTPLTSIRANVELLERARGMEPGERAQVLASVRGQLEDLTILVGDLVDLARPGERAGEPPEDLRLDELVQDAVQRARRHAPATRFALSAGPCMVCGSRARLARAIGNLLDNAVKWSPPGEPIEVSVDGGEVTVRDYGPGIADDDLPHVFDRFYRARAARGLPGSGLGLAIVKQVVEGHGGSVLAESAPGGGARLRLCLPLS
ncbi:MAG: two-component system, OmpR family, sensor histidine kinase MprB [Solirubrobacteraceae bacterium]